MKYVKTLGLAAVAAMALMAFAFRSIAETAKRYYASEMGAEASSTNTMDNERLTDCTVQTTLRRSIPTKQLAANNSISARQVCLA